MPAYLLVYYPCSKTSSVIQEKDILSGKIDLGQIVSVLYEDGKTYEAEVYYWHIVLVVAKAYVNGVKD